MRHYETPDKHLPCAGGCGMLADECECHRAPRMRSVAQGPRVTVCPDRHVGSGCSGGATYNGRCGKHAARARRARL